jgi:hypothetical protein
MAEHSETLKGCGALNKEDTGKMTEKGSWGRKEKRNLH